MNISKQRCVAFTLLMTLIINCSPAVYSLDDCYSTHNKYREELSIPLTGLVKINSVYDDISSGKAGSVFYKNEILGDREIVPLSNSIVTNYINFNPYRFRTFVLNNWRDIKRVHNSSYFGKHIGQLDDLNTPYLLEFYNDEKFYYFYWEGTNLDPFLNVFMSQVYSNSTITSDSVFVNSQALLYEKITYEDIVAFTFEQEQFSKNRYLDLLNKSKKITNDYSYFFTEHPECVDIPDFANLPNVTKSLYSKLNNEIEKMQFDMNKYPSNIDWLEF